MIKVVEGNILNCSEDIIGHQVNCQGFFNAGVAKSIKDKYPNVASEYKNDIFKLQKINMGMSKPLLGTLTMSSVQNDGKVIANLFGQDGIKNKYNINKPLTVEHKLLEALSKLKYHALAEDKTIALPYEIGCGLGGGDWNSLLPKIENLFRECKDMVTFYKYTPKRQY